MWYPVCDTVGASASLRGDRARVENALRERKSSDRPQDHVSQSSLKSQRNGTASMLGSKTADQAAILHLLRTLATPVATYFTSAALRPDETSVFAPFVISIPLRTSAHGPHTFFPFTLYDLSTLSLQPRVVEYSLLSCISSRVQGRHISVPPRGAPAGASAPARASTRVRRPPCAAVGTGWGRRMPCRQRCG